MKIAKSFFIVSLSLMSVLAQGAETDQFTKGPLGPLSDVSEILNEKANSSLLKAIKAENKKLEGCNEDALYKELRKYFNNHYKGEFTIDVLENKDIPKQSIELKKSVYQDWKIWDGIGLGLPFLQKKGFTISAVIKVGEQEIGIDKLEHMFGQGFKYFTKNYLDEKGVISAVKGGIFREKVILGGNKLATGVFSYGDLAANFNGMRFWNHMLQLRDDVLGKEHNIGPYVVCHNDQWQQVKEIDFKNYVDDSMNESINCSKFPSGATVNKFTARLKSMGLTCPVDQSRLDDMIVKYGKLAKWVINPDGAGEIKYFSEFKDKK